MTSLFQAIIQSVAVAIVAMLALWLLSLRLRDASIVDPFWGAGFILLASAAWITLGGHGPRSHLGLALVAVWGLRLSIHLFSRRRGQGEDFRYRAMREAHGAHFWIVSLGTVFALQGALMVLISTPVLAAVVCPATPLGPLDGVAVLVWLVGFLFEAIGDAQLVAFRGDAANRGRALDTGLWRYTRHPNYFGDSVQWWGFGLLGVAAGAPWTLVSPVVMSFLLVRVSGAFLLEKTLVETRPAYRDYVNRTSSFIPWPPRALPGTGAAPSGRQS
jgi:steroid 5-alpha reductase family enzyme